MKSFDTVKLVSGIEQECYDSSLQKGLKISYICSGCGRQIKLISGNLEYAVQADGRDPDCEFLVCPVCDKSVDIFNGVVRANMVHDGLLIKGKIRSDGTFVYFEYGDKKVRIG